MERALAVLIGGVGVVMLTLFAVATAGSEPAAPVRPQVDIEVLATRPLPDEALTVVEAREPLAQPAPTSTPRIPHGARRRLQLARRPPLRCPAGAGPHSPPYWPRSSAGGIRFAFAKADLDTRGAALLDRLATELAAQADLVIVVTGHTDSLGPDDVNAALSQPSSPGRHRLSGCQGHRRESVAVQWHGPRWHRWRTTPAPKAARPTGEVRSSMETERPAGAGSR